MRLKNSLSCFFFLWLFLASGITQAQEAETQKLPNLTPIWDDLDKLLTQLSQEALKQSEDLQRLSEQLEQSKTQIEGLQSSLIQSEQQLSNSEASLKAEQKLRKNWETVAKIEVGIVIGLLLFGIVGWIL